MSRIAIVVPWHGPDARGGAESHAAELAAHLGHRADVDVLTTTSRSFLDSWSEDYYSAGRSDEGAYRLHRFKLDRRDGAAFDRANEALLTAAPERWVSLEERMDLSETFIDHSINSSALIEHVRSTAYDAVIALPYLFGVVVRTIQAVPAHGYLMPCLHNESYARLPHIIASVHRAHGLLFLSDGEAELALRLYGPGILHKSLVVGAGIDAPSFPMNGARALDKPYFLYVGRRDANKNVDFLVDVFERYAQPLSDPPTLVLCGPGDETWSAPHVRDEGFVSGDRKAALLRDTLALLQPSTNESYSRVLMEAWLAGRPAVVHGDCLATATAVLQSGGGYVADEPDEWIHCLSTLYESNPSELSSLGQAGNTYARAYADWDTVIDRLMGFLDGRASAPPKGRRVDQVLQTLEFADAISENSVQIRDRLRLAGYESDIFAESIVPRMTHVGKQLGPGAIEAADVILYHYSIATDALTGAFPDRARRVLIYHNITPAWFFEPYDPDFAELLRRGREDLTTVVRRADAVVADSAFNADELRELGAQDVIIVPPVVSFARFDVVPESPPIVGHSPRWLYVGRIAPNKGLLRLLAAFDAYLNIEPTATLSLVGRFNPADAYYRHLRAYIDHRGIGSNVRFPGVVEDAMLSGYYRSSNVFMMLSEHEGFCVPLIEAMMFGLPIVASQGSAVTETLGDGGLLVHSSATAEQIAAAAHVLATDSSIREAVIQGQVRRRRSFLAADGARTIEAFVNELVRA